MLATIFDNHSNSSSQSRRRDGYLEQLPNLLYRVDHVTLIVGQDHVVAEEVIVWLGAAAEGSVQLYVLPRG